MPSLVSPGVSCTIENDSFFVPVTAPTVPLFFVATCSNKTQVDGITLAAGTAESGVVRSVTSLGQSLQLYGVPKFRTDISGNQQHGDARNEYGLLALNQFLGVASNAYVLRANIDAADLSVTSIVAGTVASPVGVGNGLLVGVSGGVPTAGPSAVAQTVNITFSDANNFSVTATFGSTTGIVGTAVSNAYFAFKILAGTVPFQAGDTYQIVYSQTTVNNPLGSTDAARRVSLATAIAEQINSNQDIRSDNIEYNIIIAPGFPELVDEMLALSATVLDEAFVVADTPFNKNPADTATWSLTSDRKNSTSVAYYYPHGIASNVDGVDVFGAASGIALRTIAYSDSVSEVWIAPAGTRRGLVTGVSKVGIVSGTLGTATTFVELNLNQGQRDILYQYFANINPIVYFPGRGIIIWGQKTSASGASSLDRINVARLMMHLKRGLRKGAMSFVFQPNDQRTRDDLKAMADSLLNDVLIRRGIYDFATKCDIGNNGPARIDANQMWLDVAVSAEKSAEFIIIPIRILSTGALGQ